MTTLYEELNTIAEEENADLSTETRVKIIGASKKATLCGLIDSGASGNHIKRSALKGIQYLSSKVNVNVRGRYAASRIVETAEFECKLPDFGNSRRIKIKAYIDEDAVGRHDIVIGRRTCSELGLVLNYKRQRVVWDELSIPMENKNRVESNITISDDPADSNLPMFMKKATHRMVNGFKPNQYDKHNYKSMVERCDHLDNNQRATLVELFSKFKELFSGKLGRVPGPPVRLKL